MSYIYQILMKSFLYNLDYSGSMSSIIRSYTSKQLLPKSAEDSLQRLHREPMNQEGLLVMLGFLEK